MSKRTNKFSPEVRERAVGLVLDSEGRHGSPWQAVMSISAKIGCAPQTLNDWVKKAEVDSGKGSSMSPSSSTPTPARSSAAVSVPPHMRGLFWMPSSSRSMNADQSEAWALGWQRR